MSIVTVNRDEDSGQFTEQYPEKAFLEAVDKLDHATTAQVAEEVGCSYDLAYRRLNSLSEDGELKRIEIGSSFIWQ